MEATMKSYHQIELDVKDELQWDPNLGATDIAASVKKGVVKLAGFVKNYADKYEAESAAKLVAWRARSRERYRSSLAEYR
jgi:osmotically-inducible protein OsmY